MAARLESFFDPEPHYKTPLFRGMLIVILVATSITMVREGFSDRNGILPVALLASAALAALLLLRRWGFRRVSVPALYAINLLTLATLAGLDNQNENRIFAFVMVLITLGLTSALFLSSLRHLLIMFSLDWGFLVFQIGLIYGAGNATTQYLTINQQLFLPLILFAVVTTQAMVIRSVWQGVLNAYRSQAQKTSDSSESLASLVRGMAHHLNTPLGNAKVLLSHVQDRGLETGVLTLISRSVDTSIDLVRRLSEFLHAVDDRNPMIVDRSMLPHLFGRGHPLHAQIVSTTSFDGSLEAQQPWEAISFAVNEILENARLHSGDLSEKPTLHLDLRPDGQYHFMVVDHGPGMDTATVEKIRQPFYSTQNRGDHPGLGLYFADYLTTQVLAGRMEIESSLGNGTRVSMFLPRHRPQERLS